MLTYQLIKNNQGHNISVLIDGELYQADSTHPCFDEIVSKSIAEDETVADLFDVAQAAVAQFQTISDRFATANGRLFLDGDEVNNTLSDHIVRALNEGSGFEPLVKFYEKLLANPNEHSREYLYRWLDTHAFSITDDGDIVGYKGVITTDDGFRSTMVGHSYVDGVEYADAFTPIKVGAVVTMPRSEVAFDPQVACSSGLHVGNYAYASDYTRDAVLEVHVNPRDVVSVPTDSNDSKVRVCRYVAIGKVEKAYDSAVVSKPKVEPFDQEAKPKRVRYPKIEDFENMVARARRRKRNFVKYALKHTTWNLIEGRDGKDRKDWSL